jgi:hypothetical protein
VEVNKHDLITAFIPRRLSHRRKENQNNQNKPKQNHDSNVGLGFPVQRSGENQAMKCNRLRQLSEPAFEG